MSIERIVHKRKGGKTTISYRASPCVKGKRTQSKSFRTMSLARKWHDAECVRLRETVKKEKKVYTFEDLLDKFTECHLEVISEQSKTKYITHIKYRIEPFFKFMKLGDINSDVLFDFRKSLRKMIEKEKIGNKCANDTLGLLSTMFKKGIDRYEMFERNPFNIDRFKVPKKDFVWWDKKEYISTFLEKTRATSRYYGAYLTAFETGMREGEIVALGPDDIDFSRAQIKVHRQWLQKHYRYAPCKHDIIRWIDFDPKSHFGTVLKTLVKDARERDSEYLFYTINGKRVVSGKISQYFSDEVIKLGLPKLTIHGARHTFASWYMEDIGDVYELMRILGHSSIQTTHKYIHNSRNRKRKAINFSKNFPHVLPMQPRHRAVSN